jgi:hypothetical protein
MFVGGDHELSAIRSALARVLSHSRALHPVDESAHGGDRRGRVLDQQCVSAARNDLEACATDGLGDLATRSRRGGNVGFADGAEPESRAVALTAQRTRLQEGVHLGRYHLARRRFHLFSDRRGSRRVALPLRGEKTPNGEIPQVDTCAESARPLTAQLSFFRARSGGGRQTGNPVT